MARSTAPRIWSRRARWASPSSRATSCGRSGPASFASLVRERVGRRPIFLSFDVDVLDPAFAPGTGTPEVGGLSTAEALAFLRALGGIDLAGADVVEVSPPYDGPGQQTALAAANVAYELLSLRALSIAQG